MRLSSRILYWTLCVCGVALFAFYSGVLTSLMTTNPSAINIKSFGDVLPNGLQMISMRDVSDEDKLKFAEEGSVLRTIYDTTMRGNNRATYATAEEAKAALRTNKDFVYFGLKTGLFGDRGIASLPLIDALADQFTFTFPKQVGI